MEQLWRFYFFLLFRAMLRIHDPGRGGENVSAPDLKERCTETLIQPEQQFALCVIREYRLKEITEEVLCIERYPRQNQN